MRALALEHLDAARDASQLCRQWQHLDADDRRDPIVLGHAARKAAAWGAQADAREWIEPVWAELSRLGVEARARVALALASVATGAGNEWLDRTEQAARSWPLDPAVMLAAGLVCAERRLWGKARQLLEPAAGNAALQPAERRKAWRTLARIAVDEGADDRAAQCHAQASAIEG